MSALKPLVHLATPSLLSDRRIAPFSKRAVDRSEKLAGLLPLALIAPKPRHAHCGARYKSDRSERGPAAHSSTRSRRLPVAGAAEGPAAEEHCAFVLHAVGLGRNVGAHPPRALCRPRFGANSPPCLELPVAPTPRHAGSISYEVGSGDFLGRPSRRTMSAPSWPLRSASVQSSSSRARARMASAHRGNYAETNKLLNELSSLIDDITAPNAAEVIAAFHTHGIIMRRGQGETIALVLIGTLGLHSGCATSKPEMAWVRTDGRKILDDPHESISAKSNQAPL